MKKIFRNRICTHVIKKNLGHRPSLFFIKDKAQSKTDCSDTQIQQRTSEVSGDRGSAVVKMLCYKSEGRWFDPSLCQWIFH